MDFEDHIKEAIIQNLEELEQISENYYRITISTHFFEIYISLKSYRIGV